MAHSARLHINTSAMNYTCPHIEDHYPVILNGKMGKDEFDHIMCEINEAHRSHYPLKGIYTGVAFVVMIVFGFVGFHIMQSATSASGAYALWGCTIIPIGVLYGIAYYKHSKWLEAMNCVCSKVSAACSDRGISFRLNSKTSYIPTTQRVHHHDSATAYDGYGDSVTVTADYDTNRTVMKKQVKYWIQVDVVSDPSLLVMPVMPVVPVVPVGYGTISPVAQPAGFATQPSAYQPQQPYQPQPQQPYPPQPQQPYQPQPAYQPQPQPLPQPTYQPYQPRQPYPQQQYQQPPPPYAQQQQQYQQQPPPPYAPQPKLTAAEKLAQMKMEREARRGEREARREERHARRDARNARKQQIEQQQQQLQAQIDDIDGSSSSSDEDVQDEKRPLM